MMHNRNDSANSLSNSSSLSSISLHDSVEIYRSLEEERARVEKANTDLHSLVNNAESIGVHFPEYVYSRERLEKGVCESRPSHEGHAFSR